MLSVRRRSTLSRCGRFSTGRPRGAALGHKARGSGALPMRARGVASIRSLSCAYRLQSERGLGGTRGWGVICTRSMTL
jgi:hypothetical protein